MIDIFGPIKLQTNSSWYILANTNMKIFESNFLDKYEYEYIFGFKNNRIWIRIQLFGLPFENNNMNKRIVHTVNLKKKPLTRI